MASPSPLSGVSTPRETKNDADLLGHASFHSRKLQISFETS
jgi:hypothetical protein